MDELQFKSNNCGICGATNARNVYFSFSCVLTGMLGFIVQMFRWTSSNSNNTCDTMGRMLLCKQCDRHVLRRAIECTAMDMKEEHDFKPERRRPPCQRKGSCFSCRQPCAPNEACYLLYDGYANLKINTACIESSVLGPMNIECAVRSTDDGPIFSDRIVEKVYYNDVHYCGASVQTLQQINWECICFCSNCRDEFLETMNDRLAKLMFENIIYNCKEKSKSKVENIQMVRNLFGWFGKYEMLREMEHNFKDDYTYNDLQNDIKSSKISLGLGYLLKNTKY